MNDLVYSNFLTAIAPHLQRISLEVQSIYELGDIAGIDPQRMSELIGEVV